MLVQHHGADGLWTEGIKEMGKTPTQIPGQRESWPKPGCCEWVPGPLQPFLKLCLLGTRAVSGLRSTCVQAQLPLVLSLGQLPANRLTQWASGQPPPRGCSLFQGQIGHRPRGAQDTHQSHLLLASGAVGT